MADIESTLKSVIEKLTGQQIPFFDNEEILKKLNIHDLNLGYSQFNELLLFLGYDRISLPFFQFLVNGTIELVESPTISKLSEFEVNVNKFITISLRLFGNLKFGYKQLSSISSSEEFEKWYENSRPKEISHYKERHPPLFDLKEIQNDDTFFLGYIVQSEIAHKLNENPEDEEIRTQNSKMSGIILKGVENHNAYLASDHMDVYVATSMRLKHEFLFVGRTIEKIFKESKLQELKVRWFDPTQAYCKDRIDKGISEALMLKRALCTIYLAQESDTLGKDSELASTLAQGKTVIAYIPVGNKKFVNDLLDDLKKISPTLSLKEIVISQLKVFDSDACWDDANIRNWVSSEDLENLTLGLDRLYLAVQKRYDSRAKTLKETHPLGIQVNLETGVANGVIVVREIDDCIEIVRRVLLNQLEFDVVQEIRSEITYTMLKESITKSVFRVSTGEKLLTNTFWNFYLNN